MLGHAAVTLIIEVEFVARQQFWAARAFKVLHGGKTANEQHGFFSCQVLQRVTDGNVVIVSGVFGCVLQSDEHNIDLSLP